MSHSILIGQSRIADALGSAVSSGRIAHAYLFHGPEGSGKRAAALQMAASLFCKEGYSAVPCGECVECTRIFSIGHPDVHLMMPYPNDTSVDAIKERLTLIGENPYAVVDFERRPSLDSYDTVSNKQVIYSRERIGAELRREMSLSSVEGGYRVAILTDAHRMNASAANAFLKLLEEPGGRTVFVLTSDRPDKLLPTIRSRCQLVRFPRLSDAEVADALVVRLEMDPVDAQTVARMADGSFSRAIDLASSDDLFSLRSLVIDYLRASFRPDGDKVIDFAEKFSRMGRESLKFFLQLMLGWFRDLLMYKNVGSAAPIVNVDREVEIHTFCQNLPSAHLESMIDLVEQASFLVERNMNLRLVFIVLAQALSRAMKGEPVEKLVASLSEEPLVV